ncbi:protease modulator HflC [Roseibium alexandrii]|jgi:membrane protease subunit HflC|uniref:Protein HflC n=2 Tax=Roseibium alexandrii TaxID=388408 RepID=A0A0M7A0W1_9HYPH|nr:protease modulator HflC [Roseibium alexandrii]EEE44293.1 Membrane protease subunit, stomatin/prohibitin-like protein [Roseibium alexandrii DFL-11]CTQ68052.1 Modulator of FtsH protease HflC [Roseibium alexandrii]
MRSGIFGIVVVVLGFLLYTSIFVVNPTQQALVLQLGRVDRVIQEPGPQLKYPFVQNVVYLDKRILDLDMSPQEVIAADLKRLVVDAFARYRISNPVLFYQRVNNIRTANQRLSTFLQSSLRSELGKASFEAIVRDDRSGLMELIRQEVSQAAAELGIEVVDVKIRRADLPDANSQAIFARMQTERQREATEIRAQGEEQSRRIRSRADRDATVLVAEANRDSEIIRGDGDAERNKIFAQAFGADPEFFAFYRSMQAYEAGLQAGDTSLVLSPDSSFFRFFKDPTGVNAPANGSGSDDVEDIRSPSLAAQ